jgi:hypothetical protein
MFVRAPLRNGPSGPSGVKGHTLPSQWGCLMVEAIRFVFDLMGLCILTHTPHSAQADSRSLQDVQDRRWIQSLGTQPCTGWLGTSGVSSDLFKSGPSADQPPQLLPPHMLQSYTTSPLHASTSLGKRTKVSSRSTTAHSQPSPSTWEGRSAPSLTRTVKTYLGAGAPLPV